MLVGARATHPTTTTSALRHSHSISSIHRHVLHNWLIHRGCHMEVGPSLLELHLIDPKLRGRLPTGHHVRPHLPLPCRHGAVHPVPRASGTRSFFLTTHLWTPSEVKRGVIHLGIRKDQPLKTKQRVCLSGWQRLLVPRLAVLRQCQADANALNSAPLSLPSW